MLPFYSAILSILKKKKVCPNCKGEFILPPEDKNRPTVTCPLCKKKFPSHSPRKKKVPSKES